MQNTKRIFNIIKAILVVAFILWINKSVNVEYLKANIAASGSLAPIAYISCFTILPALFVPTLTIVVVSATLFGFIKAMILTLIGVIFNTSLMFLISRKFAKEAIYNKLKDNISNQYFSLIYTKDQKKLVTTFFISRFIPEIPYIFENYLAGLTEIQFIPYLITTLIGVIPGLMIYLNVGLNISNVKSKNFIFSIIILIGFSTLTLIAKKIYDKNHGNNNNSNLQ